MAIKVYSTKLLDITSYDHVWQPFWSQKQNVRACDFVSVCFPTFEHSAFWTHSWITNPAPLGSPLRWQALQTLQPELPSETYHTTCEHAPACPPAWSFSLSQSPCRPVDCAAQPNPPQDPQDADIWSELRWHGTYWNIMEYNKMQQTSQHEIARDAPAQWGHPQEQHQYRFADTFRIHMQERRSCAQHFKGRPAQWSHLFQPVSMGTKSCWKSIRKHITHSSSRYMFMPTRVNTLSILFHPFRVSEVRHGLATVCVLLQDLDDAKQNLPSALQTIANAFEHFELILKISAWKEHVHGFAADSILSCLSCNSPGRYQLNRLRKTLWLARSLIHLNMALRSHTQNSRQSKMSKQRTGRLHEWATLASANRTLPGLVAIAHAFHGASVLLWDIKDHQRTSWRDAHRHTLAESVKSDYKEKQTWTWRTWRCKEHGK